MVIKKADDQTVRILLEKFPHLKKVLCTDKNGYTLVAFENNEIIAFTSVFRREIPMPLKGIFEDFINVIDVPDSRYRNMGVASALVDEVKRIAKDSGSIQVRAYCDINIMASHALWHKNSFGISPVKNADRTISGSFVTFRFLPY